MGEIIRQEEPDVLKAEHLAEGIRPIMACTGNLEEYGEEISAIEDIENVGHNANYNAHPDLLDTQGFKNSGHGTYVISLVDSKPKFTEALQDCTSLVVVGRDKETGSEISLLTHQDPKKFLSSEKEKFAKDLKRRLEELKERCTEGTIDIVIAGGNFNLNFAPEKYQQSLAALDSVVKNIFGFSPLVISGPKNSFKDDVYFDTANRRLYVVRPSQDTILHNGAFKIDELPTMKEKWEKEQENNL